MPPNYVPPRDVIIQHIRNNVVTESGCHAWKAQVWTHNGTPRFYNISIRRLIWNQSRPKLRRSDILTSSCENPRCINIDHLDIKSRAIDWDEVWERLQMHTRKEGDCMIWTSRTNNGGYGLSSLKGKNYTAHRLAYMVKLGGTVVPEYVEGKKVAIRHVCNRCSCINPAHLELGTYMENCADKIENNTINRGEKNHLTKISESLARQIKLSRYNRGEIEFKTMKARADIFGVLPSMVGDIDRGVSWAHLPDRYGNNHLETRKSFNANRTAVIKKRRYQEVTIEQFARAGKRLYSRVVKTSNNRGTVDGDCWEHDAASMDGYTRFYFDGRCRLAHVWSCEIENKRQKRADEVTRHLCGNRKCVRPTHLQFGTKSENAQDALDHGSKSAKLSADAAREIRTSDLSAKDLGIKFGVCRQAIDNVRAGRTWKVVQ